MKIIITIIIINIIIFLFIIIIISLGYPLYSLLFGLYFQLGRYPVTRHASRMLPVDLTAWAPNARGASESDWSPNQQKLETGFEKV